MIENFDNFKHVHFIGVGGIGISAVARMLLGEGKIVSGSDESVSSVTKSLEALGVRIYEKHGAQNIDEDVDLIIYTIAISDDNAELAQAKSLGVPVITYPQSLEIISKNKKTIVISGTHGKTTTTSMIATAMIENDFDPTVIVGSILKEWNSNFLPGKSDYFVVEGCEYKRSFLNLHPYGLVITNIEADHLDYYKDLADIKSAFRELAERVPVDGFIVTNFENNSVAEVVTGLACKIIDYKKANISDVSLKIPGAHNVENAQATYSVLEALGARSENIKKSLENFSGVWRRFEYIGETSKGTVVYDDYAHHPTEIKAFLKAARETFSDKKILAVFQPHLFSRTKDFLEEFAQSFGNADEIVILPIYKAREVDTGEISSQDLVDKITALGQNARLIEDFAKAKDYILNNKDENWVVTTIGAGEANLLAEQLVHI